MKNILLVSAFSSALILAACSSSSDDAAQIIADEFITVSGKTTDISDTPLPLQDVAIAGVYGAPGGLLDPTDTSGADGSFSLQVIKGDPFSLRATKADYATLNSARAALSANETGVEFGIPTEIEAQAVITLAFASATPDLADKAWLVVDVALAANGDEVNGATIVPIPAPDAFVYTDCSGADISNIATEAPCPNRPGPMYIAYYNSATEILVTVGGETQTAPVRMAEITVLEFEQ